MVLPVALMSASSALGASPKVTHMLQSYVTGITHMLQSNYKGVTVVLQGCDSVVTVVLQWCYRSL
jgi:hypothetical protein